MVDMSEEEEYVNDDKVKGNISAEIKLNCYGIKKFEIPAARRHVVMKTYEELISDLYERLINRVGDLKGKDDLDAA
jgi:hypothetical protein